MLLIPDKAQFEQHQETLDRVMLKYKQLQKARPLGSIALHKMQETLSLEWTYNSNSIEGNTITLIETQLVLQDGMTVKGKSLREHFEIFNHHKALGILNQFVQKKSKLSAEVLLDIHRVILQNIEEDYAGRLRNSAVRIIGADFVPPNARKVSPLLDELIQYVNSNPQNLNPICLATIFHHLFVWIHPFFDGNGRTVRIAMNLILMQVGFPPAIILSNDRKKYYTALNSANKQNYDKLYLLMLQAIERGLNLYLSALPAYDYEYFPISKIVEEASIPYGQEYVSLLARRGHIAAHKEGRNWVTTKQAVLAYLQSKQTE